VAEDCRSATEQALLLALRPRIEPEQRAELQRLLDGKVVAEEFAALAAQHAVAGWLYERLRCLDLLEGLPAGARTRLREGHRFTAGRNLALLSAAAPVLRALEQERIPFAVIGGLAQAVRDYGSLALRRMADVDILVPPERMQRVAELCREAGYEPKEGHSTEYWERHHGARPFFRPFEGLGALGLDVQSRLTPAPPYPFQLDETALLARTELLEHQGLGPPIPCLSAEDELVHLSHHQFHHEFEGLRCVCDTAVLLSAHPELDWDLVVARAEAARLQLVLYAALLLARRALRVEVPEEVWDRLRPSAGRRWVLSRVLTAQQCLTLVTEEVRRTGRSRHVVRLSLLLCGPGLRAPYRLLSHRFWRHPEEVWLTSDRVPAWAASKPLYAAHRVLTLGGRAAKVLVSSSEAPAATEEKP